MKMVCVRAICLYYRALCPGEYEYESYDGWYNNPAHPEWGGAGKPVHCDIDS